MAGVPCSADFDLQCVVTTPAALPPVAGVLAIPTGPGLDFGIGIVEAAMREADKDLHRRRGRLWRLRDGSFAEW